MPSGQVEVVQPLYAEAKAGIERHDANQRDDDDCDGQAVRRVAGRQQQHGSQYAQDDCQQQRVAEISESANAAAPHEASVQHTISPSYPACNLSKSAGPTQRDPEGCSGGLRLLQAAWL